jgi:glycosyltransferase involved in cell wall biosynthesis
MNEICIVAPIYNEETNVSEFIKRVAISLEKINSNHQIILVDDGSKDNSWKAIKDESTKNKKIKALKLSKNYGHHYAITAGLHHSNANWTVVMDSDLQDRPEVILDLYKKAKEGFDVVFVARINRPESILYLFFQRLFYFILNILSGIKFESRQANFSIINKCVVEAFKNFPENKRFYGSTIKWFGFKTTYIEAEHGLRFSGKPSYTIRKRLKLASDIILAFSDRPLKFAIGIGLLLAFIAAIIGTWIFWRALSSDYVVMGWPSTIVVILFVGGTILSVLGILGIYVSRIYNEVKQRPLYWISEFIN